VTASFPPGSLRSDATSRRFPLHATKLLILALSLGLGFYFWTSPALRPLKLLVVMMHETGHAVATLLVGGRVDRVTIAGDESGACLSALPPGMWRAVIVYSAGYLGSALAGALLLLATFRWNMERAMLALLALWLVFSAWAPHWWSGPERSGSPPGSSAW
jgi:hypothetical protein